MASKIQLDFYQDKAGKWRWRLLAQNGNIILASTQGYTTLASAGKNIARAQAMLGSLAVARFEVTAPIGSFRYRSIVASRHDASRTYL